MFLNGAKIGIKTKKCKFSNKNLHFYTINPSVCSCRAYFSLRSASFFEESIPQAA